MSGSEALVFITMIGQSIAGLATMVIRALMKALEPHVGRTAAGIILLVAGVLLGFLAVRTLARRLIAWRAGRRMRALRRHRLAV